tara:strand:- start:236 stop:373 length:138 start_codon:yes stop_codon:yes gene_type:complete
MLKGVIPDLSAAGLVDYAGLAIGLTLGFALLSAPMEGLEKAISKN